MEYKIIYEIDKNLLMQAARLHHDSLSYRSFITLFGKEFLYRIYETILIERLGFFVFALEQSQVKGFVLGCTDSTRLIRIMLKRIRVFIPFILKTVFKKISLTKNLFETLFYSKKEGEGIKPELIAIVVDEEKRSKGVGTDLVRNLNAEFKKQGILRYKVTVHKEMLKPNNFYLRNGMRPLKDFVLYGHVWNVYVNEL